MNKQAHQLCHQQHIRRNENTNFVKPRHKTASQVLDRIEFDHWRRGDLPRVCRGALWRQWAVQGLDGGVQHPTESSSNGHVRYGVIPGKHSNHVSRHLGIVLEQNGVKQPQLLVFVTRFGHVAVNLEAVGARLVFFPGHTIRGRSLEACRHFGLDFLVRRGQVRPQLFDGDGPVRNKHRGGIVQLVWRRYVAVIVVRLKFEAEELGERVGSGAVRLEEVGQVSPLGCLVLGGCAVG
mmetsp:Transcript_7934/g.23402  ORF Transcript_7934/g.23402 Transcript_7934/m.23402 type:complete len:236 (-) Transcript_7934:693-1400(-)